MKFAWLGCLLWGSLLLAGNQLSEFNVNSRYTVESVELSGGDQTRMSKGLREEMTKLVGTNLDVGVLEQLSRCIRRELHVRSVTHRVLRGTLPEHVKVVFEAKGSGASFELSVPKFLYHSQEGWSGAAQATANLRSHGFTLGLVSDGDELLERYTGFLARYENRHVGTDRVRFRMEYAAYHDLWNGATRDAAFEPPAETAGVYRNRQSITPTATFVLARPLTLSVGATVQQFEPEAAGARTESANALVTTLRYHQILEGESQQVVDAGYQLRAATRMLESDFVYVRHRWDLQYSFAHGKHVVVDDFMAGLISGRAPLFERFVVGNASTLRGWNKYELDPLGGSRVASNTLEYRYRVFQVFYDTGAIWDPAQSAVVRHSAGVGVRQGAFSLAVAFPLREGHIEPIFMVGMNY